MGMFMPVNSKPKKPTSARLLGRDQQPLGFGGMGWLVREDKNQGSFFPTPATNLPTETLKEATFIEIKGKVFEIRGLTACTDTHIPSAHPHHEPHYHFHFMN